MSEPLSTIKVPILRKTAKVQLTIETPAVQNLQHILGVLLEGRDATDLPKKITDKSPLEPWEQGVAFLSWFIQHIYQVADIQGHVDYKEMTAEDMMSSVNG